MEFRLFTVEQANRMLPELVWIIREVNRRRQDLIYLLVELESLTGQAAQRNAADLALRVQRKRTEVAQRRSALASLVESVGEMGVIVRDFERGLVDFPGVVNGQPGYLCWTFEEEEVRFWHGPEAGFAGRQPLSSTPS